ncbi:uncharacterized protein LOC127790643 [Diospyros lotus]|uniref:uncharacterized protein LOC127790643 n=1 Tax=Diospyros lotus TaxID=55363 RepID=UPI0022553B8F|nr:uncharacterized protein LOC127790643 [Diospyros lotus]
MDDLRQPVLPTPSPPLAIEGEHWTRAEAAAHKIIGQVQPTHVSERRRGEVIYYVQRLIRGRLGCEVFPFGSVPLKTYLPDGDIDLTTFGGVNIEDSLVNDVISVLQSEEKSSAAEFVVKDVQLIRAEVKLVKCIIQNIVVDISFSQSGGLCTLCFLELVDRFIGKDHLFKRSIILIKAWCYYESRILGAHHGLISTYGLETLVLYIFHLFHSKLNGPLAVLYRFLDYFSKFDWDNYCISLTGPVRKSSLPAIVAEEPEDGGSDLLLSKDFLRHCADMFSIPSRGVDTNLRAFPHKHLNIVDPLKENNNLGRSVSKGNFCRIRSAFTYGSRKLWQILLHQEDRIPSELYKFFSNTLDRHGSGQRPDVQDPVPITGDYCSLPRFLFPANQSSQDEKIISELKSANSVHLNGVYKLNLDGSSNEGSNYVEASGMEMKKGRTVNEHKKSSEEVVNSAPLSEIDGSINRVAAKGHRFSGDAEDLATSKFQSLRISSDPAKVNHSSGEEEKSQRPIVHFAPHLFFSGSASSNAMVEHGKADVKGPENTGLTGERVSSGLLPLPDEAAGIFAGYGREKSLSFSNQDMLATDASKDVALISNPVSCSSAAYKPGYREMTCVGAACSPGYLQSLIDLSGDYESHFNSLNYVRQSYEHSSSVPALPVPPAFIPQLQNKSSWDLIQNGGQFKRDGLLDANVNGVVRRPPFHPMNSLLIPGGTFGVEEIKPRGTGTYIPHTNRPPYQKPLTGRAMNQEPARSPRNSGRAATTMEAIFPHNRSSHEHFSSEGNAKPGPSDFSGAHSPGHVRLGVQLVEGSKNASSLTQTPAHSHPTREMQKSKPVLGMNQDRMMAGSSYRLKNEDDFPPLPV